MQLIIKSSSGVCDGMPGMHRLIPPLFSWAIFPKSPFDTFITVTYTVDWFIAYKCCYRGEALGFWIWLGKKYLHNQVFGNDFSGSDEIDTRGYPFTAPTQCSGQWECEEECICGSNTFVKCSCASSWLHALYSAWLTQVFYIFTLSMCR